MFLLLSTFMNCYVWMIYSKSLIKNGNALLYIVNSVGLYVDLFYLCVYVCHATDSKKRLVYRVAVTGLFSVVAIVVVAVFCFHSRDHRVVFVGIIADVFSIIMYASHLAIWTRKSVEYMHFWLSFAVLCNGICWTVYALLEFNIFILVASGVGAIYGAIQLCLLLLPWRKRRTE
ncbi:hypothetical protein V6N11_070136 [Hibiscus sabdariffa]|uniref:Uncharacterized protein n=1 Tax=Hibiscus sabdariffa TaxID=183260 RepID=A0ABR2QEM4_9ROSI